MGRVDSVMAGNVHDLAWGLGARLKAAIAKHRVPGASIALYAGETLHEAAAGVLNNDTGVEATTDSLFHIASITKPMTTTLAMQLVDEGKLDLDATVKHYLPQFRVASREASERITVRQLLSHASGVDGDLFIETTRGEDRVAKLVEAGHVLEQLHEPGRGFSYCNHGFAIAGRILEVLDGSDFDTIWRKRLSAKLNAPTLLTLTRDALRYRVAVGHVGAKNTVPSQIFLGTSAGPAGATPMARARDLVSFALMHLNGGVTREGVRVLSEGAVRAMQEPQTHLPASASAHHFGLGWMLIDWGGHKIFGHDGVSIFQRSYLRISPDKRTVFSLLTNGGDGVGLFRELATEFFGEAGITMTPVLEAAKGVRIDVSQYAGSYERFGSTTTVGEKDGALTMTSAWTADWARELYGVQGPFALEPAGNDLFLWRVPAAEPIVVAFVNRDGDGRFKSLYSGVRLSHRQ
jgi:CubicO group peptidase (beta-lactamase class C family)